MQYITPFAPAFAETFLLIMACIILLLDVFTKDEKRVVTYGLTLATLFGCFLITGSTIDLTRKIKTLDLLTLKSVMELVCREIVVFNCIARPKHFDALKSRNTSQSF